MNPQLLSNLNIAHKMLSNWVMGTAGTLGVIWFSLPPDQQKLLIEHSPIPAWAYPIALTVVGILARLWPQKAFTTVPTP